MSLSTRLRVAILGSGPAGLIAAHAAMLMGTEQYVFSMGGKSDLFGAQYLHAPIPGLYQPPGKMIRYSLNSTSEEYRRKVYGDNWEGSVSPEDLESEHFGWDIRTAYDELWNYYGSRILNTNVTPVGADDILLECDLMISSIPRTAMCMNKRLHMATFQSEQVYALGDTPDRKIPYDACPDFTVMLNGRPEPSWYRLSNIFGYKTVEWPFSDNKPPLTGIARVTKPLAHACDCWEKEEADGRIVFVGRYGEWKKGVLSHEAFAKTQEAIRAWDGRALPRLMKHYGRPVP